MFSSRDGRSAELKLPLFNDGRHMRIRRNSVISKLHPDHTHSDRKYQKHGCRTRATNRNTTLIDSIFYTQPSAVGFNGWISSGWRRVTTLPYPSLDESMAGRTGTKQMPRSMVHGSADLELAVFIRSSNGARTYSRYYRTSTSTSSK